MEDDQKPTESENDQMEAEIKCGILHNCPCDRGCREVWQCVTRAWPSDHPFAAYLIQEMLRPKRIKRAVKR